jgi:hypothetical protein
LEPDEPAFSILLGSAGAGQFREGGRGDASNQGIFSSAMQRGAVLGYFEFLRLTPTYTPAITMAITIQAAHPIIYAALSTSRSYDSHRATRSLTSHTGFGHQLPSPDFSVGRMNFDEIVGEIIQGGS